MVYFLKFLRAVLPASLASKWLGAPGFYGNFKSWDEAGAEIEKRTGKSPEPKTSLVPPHNFRMPH